MIEKSIKSVVPMALLQSFLFFLPTFSLYEALKINSATQLNKLKI